MEYQERLDKEKEEREKYKEEIEEKAKTEFGVTDLELIDESGRIWLIVGGNKYLVEQTETDKTVFSKETDIKIVDN